MGWKHRYRIKLTSSRPNVQEACKCKIMPFPLTNSFDWKTQPSVKIHMLTWSDLFLLWKIMHTQNLPF